MKAEANPIIDEYIYIDANFASVPPAQCIRVRKFDANFFEAGGFDKAQWEAYATLLGKNVYDMLGYYFKDRLISEWDSIFYNDIAPLLFERICKNISLGGFSALDLSSETKYKGNFALMKVNLRGTGSNKKRNEISQVQLAYANAAALTNDLVTLSVRNVSIRYFTAHYNGTIYSGYIGDDLVDGSLLYTPENANEKRNPKKEDAYIAARLSRASQQQSGVLTTGNCSKNSIRTGALCCWMDSPLTLTTSSAWRSVGGRWRQWSKTIS